MQWRKAWEKNWDFMRYCSDSCRRHKLDKNSLHIREAILFLTKKSGPSKPVTQEDIVKYLWPDEGMTRLEEVRRIARILHYEKLITIIQNGTPISDLNFKGPVQFRSV
jgi:hypothetical protein